MVTDSEIWLSSFIPLGRNVYCHNLITHSLLPTNKASLLQAFFCTTNPSLSHTSSSPIPIPLPVHCQLHSGWNYSPTSSGSSRQSPDLLQLATSPRNPRFPPHSPSPQSALRSPQMQSALRDLPPGAPEAAPPAIFPPPPPGPLLRPHSRHSLPPPLPPQLHLQPFGIAALPHGATGPPGAAERPLCVWRPPEGAARRALPRLRGGRGPSSLLRFVKAKLHEADCVNGTA